MNKKHYILFIVKNILLVQFSLCHTSDENVLASNFSQTTVSIFIGVDILVLISEFVVVVILSEWWSVPTTANHCGYITDHLHDLCAMGQ